MERENMHVETACLILLEFGGDQSIFSARQNVRCQLARALLKGTLLLSRDLGLSTTCWPSPLITELPLRADVLLWLSSDDF